MISFKVTYHVHRNFLLFCSAVLVRSGGKGFTTTEQSSYAQHTEATVRGSSSLAQHIACGSSTYSGVYIYERVVVVVSSVHQASSKPEVAVQNVTRTCPTPDTPRMFYAFFTYVYTF